MSCCCRQSHWETTTKKDKFSYFFKTKCRWPPLHPPTEYNLISTESIHPRDFVVYRQNNKKKGVNYYLFKCWYRYQRNSQFQILFFFTAQRIFKKIFNLPDELRCWTSIFFYYRKWIQIFRFKLFFDLIHWCNQIWFTLHLVDMSIAIWTHHYQRFTDTLVSSIHSTVVQS